MAAPSDTTRQTPGGIALDEGFPAKIAFARDPDASFWEKEVTPPGIDSGDAIEISTQHNVEWETMAARRLKKMTDGSLTVAYDPVVYNNILQLVGEPDAITQHFPDGSKLSYYGFLKDFIPGAMVRGEQPEAEITIITTNWDPVNRVEASPVMTAVAGT